jgi:hypothetical protein
MNKHTCHCSLCASAFEQQRFLVDTGKREAGL